MRAFVGLLIVLAVASIAGAQCFPEASCRYTEPPPDQVIAAGDVVSSRDACGTLKRISSAGAVTTNTTDTFSFANAGCFMFVCNTGANNITLDNNAKFVSAAGADVVMTPSDCVVVISFGTGWIQAAPLEAN
jgi:hypothetical protein